MSQTTEFIYFQLKPTVKPEVPGNEEGTKLLDAFNATKHQSGYHSSAWGRTVEDESVVVWVIVWTDARGASHTPTILSPFLADNTTPTTLYTTLVPPIPETSATLTSNPVTELCTLAFPTSLTGPEHQTLNQHLVDFRAALTDAQGLDQADRPVSWSAGYVERPGSVKHGASPSGEAFVVFLAVGWGSVERHMAVKGTKEFTGGIKGVREMMLGALEGLGMKHVSFKGI